MIRKAMIMAAGVGTRLNPLTLKVPKPMIPVINRPILDFILAHLQKFGINNVVANTHYLAEAIQDVYGEKNHLGINFQYVYESELTGTAGGVKKTEFFFDSDETFIVISGDALTDVNIEKLYEEHKKSGAMATMALKEIPMAEVEHFGVVMLDKDSRVAGFQEKPCPEEAKSNLVNTGIYIFEPAIFKYIPANQFYDFAKNVFPAMMKNNEALYAHVISDYWNDIGTIKQYKSSSLELLNSNIGIEMPYTKTENGWIADTCRVSPLAVFKNTAVIGEGSIVEDNVKFSENNIIGNNCLIKAGARIENSVIWDNVVIGENVSLDNCIIANNVKIEANLSIASDVVIGHDKIISCPEDYLADMIKV